MESNEELKKEMQQLSPGFPVKPDVPAPPGYLDKLPDRIMARWQNEKQQGQGHQMSIRRMMATAAIVTGICLGVVWWTHQTVPVGQMREITASEAYDYILENMVEFSSIIQQEQWITDEKQILPTSSEVEEYLIEELDGEEIENIF